MNTSNENKPEASCQSQEHNLDDKANNSTSIPQNTKINYGDIPLLTIKQFIILTSLLDGEKCGRHLRTFLNGELKIKQSLPAFYQLIGRLDDGGYVNAETKPKEVAGKMIRERWYKISPLGIIAHQKTGRHFDRSIALPAFQPA
jgi:hypothetical protein